MAAQAAASWWSSNLQAATESCTQGTCSRAIRGTASGINQAFNPHTPIPTINVPFFLKTAATMNAAAAAAVGAASYAVAPRAADKMSTKGPKVGRSWRRFAHTAVSPLILLASLSRHHSSHLSVPPTSASPLSSLPPSLQSPKQRITGKRREPLVTRGSPRLVGSEQKSQAFSLARQPAHPHS